MPNELDNLEDNARIRLDPKIVFLVSIPDGEPHQATPFQGFANSLCLNSGLLGFFQHMPTDIFELTPAMLPHRIARRIAGLAPVTWYGQSPRALKSQPLPIATAFAIVMLDRTETAEDYAEWLASCPGPITLVAESGGHISYSDLSLEAVQARFIEVCGMLRARGTVEHVDWAETAISNWVEPDRRQLHYDIGGHGTIFPNAAVLRVCGFENVGETAFSRHHEGEKALIEQIVLTTNSIFDEREANPPSHVNRFYPRTPDLNLYLPATYELKSVLQIRPNLDRKLRRDTESALRILDRQSSYSFELASEAKQKVALGITAESLKKGEQPKPNPIIDMRQREVWLGTQSVGCLATSEIGAVVRLPNRLNHTRGLVRQFAQHYRAHRPQTRKRSELFRGVQRAISDGFPNELQALLDRSKDGIRIIADAHLEWLDVRGIPLGLRYNASRIPVTPGNSFITSLWSQQPLELTPEDFRQVLIVSGLSEADTIAKPLTIALDGFSKLLREKLEIKMLRVKSRQELVDAFNAFEGVLMLFDGHGSHTPDQPGFLWLGDEAVDVWELRDEIRRAPPIVILSACDTHAADRNHATVANGFLAMGSRSVLGSVFPLHASHAALFAARLLYRVSDYIPAFISSRQRSLTWLEVVSGMLRRQTTTDIVRHLENIDLIKEKDFRRLFDTMHWIVETEQNDPFSHIRQQLLTYGVPEHQLDLEIHAAIASSSTISYLHIGRPETILINSLENLNNWEKVTMSEDQEHNNTYVNDEPPLA